jgi:hypothetical protein
MSDKRNNVYREVSFNVYLITEDGEVYYRSEAATKGLRAVRVESLPKGT